MVAQVFAVLCGNVRAESLGELGAYLCSVQCDGEWFIELCLQGGKGLVCDVGVAVYLAAAGRIARLDVALDKVEAVFCLVVG